MVNHAQDTFARVQARTFAIALVSCVGLTSLHAAETFPEPRPLTGNDAVQLLCPGVDPGPCLRAGLAGSNRTAAGSPARRVLERLGNDFDFGRLSRVAAPAVGELRFSLAEVATDSMLGRDLDLNGVPWSVGATLDGLALAAELLHAQLELPRPAVDGARLVRLANGVTGFTVPVRIDERGAVTLVIAIEPERDDAAARRSAALTYAWAVANGAGLDPIWSEGFAQWVALRVGDGPDPRQLARLARGLGRLSDGLVADSPDDAGSLAAWFAFLDESFGLSAVRLTVEELAGDSSPATALDRAARRASAGDLAALLREFHLWTLLVGDRADDRHFSFARALPSPVFSSVVRGLPAISLQSEPPLAPLGAAHVAIAPELTRGGMALRFEGGFGSQWEADLLLNFDSGIRHRLALSVSPEGRAALTVPAAGVTEALLLVRLVSSDDGATRRFSFTAHREERFPFDLVALDARLVQGGERGVLVTWETASEHDLVGFNVVRRTEGGGSGHAINPVWIPALGNGSEPTTYRFLDRLARPGVSYTYRVQAITTSGLTSESDPVAVQSR